MNIDRLSNLDPKCPSHALRFGLIFLMVRLDKGLRGTYGYLKSELTPMIHHSILEI
jgi:hypothetical protein